jgi:hypothetical protein
MCLHVIMRPEQLEHNLNQLLLSEIRILSLLCAVQIHQTAIVCFTDQVNELAVVTLTHLARVNQLAQIWTVPKHTLIICHSLGHI